MSIWNAVRGLERVSLCDWPGKPCAVIFIGGCNFRCPTCHNWELATNPNGIDLVPQAEVMDYLTARREWLEGVVITGGEPTLHPVLPSLIYEVRKLGYPVNLHTNGSNPVMVELLLEQDLVELFSVDVKGPWKKYPALTETFSASEARRCLEAIFDLARVHPARFKFRTTAVPELSEADLRICKSYLPTGHELTIQKYREPVRS